MADIGEVDEESRQSWAEWVASRPEKIRAVAEKLFPWKLYRMKGSGHRVTLYSIDEEESGKISLQVDVTGEFNFVAFERRVFGVDPDDLEECDLPAPDDPLGSANMTPEEAVERMKQQKARKPS